MFLKNHVIADAVLSNLEFVSETNLRYSIGEYRHNEESLYKTNAFSHIFVSLIWHAAHHFISRIFLSRRTPVPGLHDSAPITTGARSLAFLPAG